MSYPIALSEREQPALPPHPRAHLLARLISHLTHPPIVAASGIALIAVATMHASEWWWAAEYVLLVVLMPTLFILVQVWRGKLSDFQLQQRHERALPYTVALICAALGALTLMLGNAPRVLQRVGWMTLLMTAALLVITLRWKISAHCAYAATFAILVSALLQVSPVLLWVGVSVVAWARVTLRRHDLWQTFGGAAVGAASALIALQ